MTTAIRLMVLLISAATSGLLYGQDNIRVSASLASQSAFVGDPVSLEIVVEGSTDARPPDLSGIDGFQAEYLGDENRSMTSMSFVNGRRTQSETVEYVFRFALTPLRAGSLKLPPIEVAVDGKPYSTQPVWIEVRAAQASEDYILRVEADKSRLYVGEPVTIRLTWYISSACNGGRFSGPEPGDDFDLASPADPRVSKPGVDPKRYIDFTFLGSPAVGERGSGRLNGREFQTLAFSQVLIPRRAGALRFGPINLAFDQVTGQSRDIFDRRLQTRRMVIASEPLDFEVLPLPSEGRPADFSGLVGSYSISAAANPTSASVGDPISLSIRIQGPEPLPGVEAPDLGLQSGFPDAFKLASEGWTAVQPQPPGERVFSTTIRAKSDSSSRIPPIGMSYFDPDSGRYRRAESSPIPISIEATREVTAADAVVTGAPSMAAGPGLERIPLLDGAAGIRAGDRGPGLLGEADPDALGWAAGPVGVAVLTGPVLAFGVAAMWRPVQRTWAAPRRRALRRAERSIQCAMTTDRPAEAIGAAVRGFVGTAMSQPAAALTARDCENLVAERAPGSASAITEVLEDCEAACYGRRTADGASLGARAIGALRALDADLRRRA